VKLSDKRSGLAGSKPVRKDDLLKVAEEGVSKILTCRVLTCRGALDMAGSKHCASIVRPKRKGVTVYI
jgi:hypothetical protein